MKNPAPLLLLLGLFLGTPVASAQTITLQTSAATERSHVTLGEVARIVSDDPSVTAGLAGIFLGKVPGSYDREWIRLRLSQSGVKTQDLRFEGAPSVQVRRGTSAPNPVDRPRKASQEPPSPAALRTIPGGREPVPAPALDVRRDRPDLERGGQVAPDAHPVVVARRNLRRGTLLGADNLGIRSIVRPGPHTTTTERLIGARLLRSVPAGTPIAPAWVRREPIVRPGMLVEVVYHGTGFTIRAPGRVRKSGALGERVPVSLVLNRKTGPREVLGRVTGRGLIEVDENSPPSNAIRKKR